MKRKHILINSLAAFFVLVSTAVFAENTKKEPAQEGVKSTDTANIDKDLGYFFGFSFGNMLKEGGNKGVDLGSLLQGMHDALEGKQPALDETQQLAVIEAVKTRRSEIQKQQNTAQILDGDTFLEQNASAAGVTQTASGLQYIIVEEGTGVQPAAGDVVVVHYAGQLLNGQEFDSSIKRGQPAEFALNQVIAGWTEGLQLMKAGGKTRFFIPPDLAYGSSGTRGIPGHAVLVFDIELLEVK